MNQTRPIKQQSESEYSRDLRIRFAEGLAQRADEGWVIPASVVQARRNLTAEQLKAAEIEGRVISISSPDGEAYYPSCFGEQSLVESVEAVMQKLTELPWLEKWTFLMRPALSLNGRSPAEALADGNLDEVLQAAEVARLKFSKC